MAQGFQRREYFNPAQVNTGGAQVYGGLMDRFRSFAQSAKANAEAITVPDAQAAGAQAGAAGDTKLKAGFTPEGRAYNEGLVRAYALDVYADVHENLTRIETESGTDPDKFKAAVEGYRNGLLPNLMGRAQPIIQQALQEREMEGLTRIQTLRAEEAHKNAQAQAERGRVALSDQISRYLTSTDQAMQERGLGLLQTYNDSVDADVAAGLLNPREGQSKKDKAIQDANKQIVIGRLEGELEAPGGNPVAVIQDMMKAGSPLMSDAEKVQFVGQLVERVNLHQRMTAEQHQMEAADVKSAHEEGEKQATELLLKGQLTQATILRMVENDSLDPTVARTLRNELKSGGTRMDDDAEAFKVGASVLDYTEQEIATNPRLSWDTKSKLIEKRRQQVGGWQDTNPMQEARRRIDAELGIVPGTQQLISDEKGRQRGRALTELYNRLEALPENERESKALEVAQSVITDTLRNTAASSLVRAQDRLEAKRAELTDDLGARERKIVEDEIARLEKVVADLKARAAK